LTSVAQVGSAPRSVTAATTSQFVAVGRLFDLEYAGQFIRIWCGACDKFEHLDDDAPETVDAARAAHRCGARTSEWALGDLGTRA
jgi:hypothetical protein